MTVKSRISWYIFARLMVVSFFLVATIFFKVQYPVESDSEASTGFIRLIVATYLFSLLSLYLLKFEKVFPGLTNIQIIWDLFLVTLLILFTGGITSPYSFLYLLCIVSSCVLLARREAFYAASLCAILYGGLLDLQYFGKLTSFGLSPLPSEQYGPRYFLYTIFLHIGAFCLTALLTGYLSERTRKSERALLDKVIDYEELDRLNTCIVANLNSGLLTLNSEGRIRVFNQFAETLTGLKQAEAYDRYLHEIFPNICYFGGTIDSVQRGEFNHRGNEGENLVIGFKSVPLTDVQGERSGVIVIFQDLTQLKTMEEELKKADRLSAIGQLAAHIAHEIRNPLASISGSVQLLAEGDGISEKDRKLTEIVVRETDRLNKLIKDFLAYARPLAPVKRAFPLSELLYAVELLLSQDPRFEKVKLEISCDTPVTLYADYDQIEQVVWNLLVNAAEAMSNGGTVSLKVKKLPRTLPEKVQIVINDTGCGMDAASVERVFEPFFTTKKGGTGLGLATVYRIVDSHGGTISVKSSRGKGTEFTTLLPITPVTDLEEQERCSNVF